MSNKTKVGVTVAVLGSALIAGPVTAQAAEGFRKEAGAGMATGAVVGAVVGGPIGAAVGFMMGGIVGDNVGATKSAERQARNLEQELADVRLALLQSQEKEQTGSEPMFADLAQRLHGDVLFKTGSDQLSEQAAGQLARLGALMASYPDLDIELHGFADPRGKVNDNIVLSQRRAETVREALVAGGAQPGQIRISAHGEDLVTAPLGDLEAYAWERRVSVAIRPRSAGAVAEVR